MFSLLAAVALNIAPIQNIHLDTEKGKVEFSQKVQLCANELEQKWGRVTELQKALDETLIKLSTTARESDEWKTVSAEAELLAQEWQYATMDIPELKAIVDAGLKGMQETAHVIALVKAVKKGEEISDADQELLEHIAVICEKN
jgi:hypothetical protein